MISPLFAACVYCTGLKTLAGTRFGKGKSGPQQDAKAGEIPIQVLHPVRMHSTSQETEGGQLFCEHAQLHITGVFLTLPQLISVKQGISAQKHPW